MKFSVDMFPKQAPGVCHNVFFVHIFLVGCDEVETYRNFTRKQIQEWLNTIMSKRNQEWIICHVASDTKSKGLFNLGGGANIYDKLKSDFNQHKRCMQLRGNSQDDWADLSKRINECVANTLSSQISQYEQDYIRLEEQRMMPGWNYCQYFILKEALVFTFELVGLYKDALNLYDELEASFFQTMSEQGIPWFRKFGGTGAEDDSRDVLDYASKNYRELMIQNLISIFDFRLYLFSRQIQLLIKLNLPNEVNERSIRFISTFSSTLKEYKVKLN